MTLSFQNNQSFRQPGAPADKYLRVFLWGLWKSGKTVVSSTFPAPLFVHPFSEGGYGTFGGPYGSLFPYYALGINFNEWLASLGGMKVSDELNNIVAELYTSLKMGTCPYQTIVLGGFSIIANMVYQEGAKLFTDSQKQWGHLSAWSKTFTGMLFSLPMHVIVEVSAKEARKDRTGYVETLTPDISGQSKTMYLNSANVIAFQEVRGQGLFQTHFRPVVRKNPADKKAEPKQYALAKSRFSQLDYPNPVVDCCYDHFAQPLGLPPLSVADPYHPRCQPGVWQWPHPHA